MGFNYSLLDDSANASAPNGSPVQPLGSGVGAGLWAALSPPNAPAPQGTPTQSAAAGLPPVRPNAQPGFLQRVGHALSSIVNGVGGAIAGPVPDSLQPYLSDTDRATIRHQALMRLFTTMAAAQPGRSTLPGGIGAGLAAANTGTQQDVQQALQAPEVAQQINQSAGIVRARQQLQTDLAQLGPNADPLAREAVYQQGAARAAAVGDEQSAVALDRLVQASRLARGAPGSGAERFKPINAGDGYTMFDQQKGLYWDPQSSTWTQSVPVGVPAAKLQLEQSKIYAEAMRDQANATRGDQAQGARIGEAAEKAGLPYVTSGDAIRRASNALDLVSSGDPTAVPDLQAAMASVEGGAKARLNGQLLGLAKQYDPSWGGSGIQWLTTKAAGTLPAAEIPRIRQMLASEYQLAQSNHARTMQDYARRYPEFTSRLPDTRTAFPTLSGQGDGTSLPDASVTGAATPPGAARAQRMNTNGTNTSVTPSSTPVNPFSKGGPLDPNRGTPVALPPRVMLPLAPAGGSQ